MKDNSHKLIASHLQHLQTRLNHVNVGQVGNRDFWIKNVILDLLNFKCNFTFIEFQMS